VVSTVLLLFRVYQSTLESQKLCDVESDFVPHHGPCIAVGAYSHT
jgi:hypothetical protein